MNSPVFKPANPEFAQMVREKMNGNHFMNFVGYTVTDIKAGRIEAELELREEHRQQMGFVHGGVTATFADIVCGFAAFTLAPNGNGVVTVDMKVNFLNPGSGSLLRGTGRVYKAGQRLFFCEAEIFCDELLIAKADCIMANVTPESMISAKS